MGFFLHQDCGLKKAILKFGRCERWIKIIQFLKRKRVWEDNEIKSSVFHLIFLCNFLKPFHNSKRKIDFQMWIFPALVWLNQHIWIFNIIKLPRSFQAETITNKKGFKVSGHKMFAHKVFRIEKYHHLNLHMAQLLKNVRRVGLLFLKETKKVILRGKSAPFDSWGLVNFSVIWKNSQI